MKKKPSIPMPYECRGERAKLAKYMKKLSFTLAQQILKAVSEKEGKVPANKAKIDQAVRRYYWIVKNLELQMHYNIDYKLDMEREKKKAVNQQQDMALVKYNEADMLIWKQAFLKCQEREVKVSSGLHLPQPTHLNIKCEDGSVAPFESYLNSLAQKQRKEQLNNSKQLQKIDKFLLERADVPITEAKAIGGYIDNFPRGDWDLLD